MVVVGCGVVSLVGACGGVLGGVVCDSGRGGFRGLSPLCCISAARSPHGAVPSSCLVASGVVALDTVVSCLLLGTCVPVIWLGLTVVAGRAEMRCLILSKLLIVAATRSYCMCRACRFVFVGGCASTVCIFHTGNASAIAWR